ncbi:MAG TPA: hypothetical protein PLO67_21365 [Saprospiraceae bacterium]|nr:hypothetical protein [Saprospiraceae bacterium]HPI08542.1 hypothetical protein [Saprospiraceae bacterium]
MKASLLFRMGWALFLTAGYSARGQDTLRVESFRPVLERQLPVLNQWLRAKHLDSFIRLDAVDLDHDKITLVGNVAGKTNWDRLNHQVDSLLGRSAGEWLFEKLSFLMDDPDLPFAVESRVRLFLKSPDITIIVYQNAAGEIKVRENEHMGVVEGQIALPLPDMPAGENHTISIDQVSEQVLEKVKTGLDLYFRREDKKYFTWLRGYPEIKSFPYTSGKLVLKVMNVKGLVLKDAVSWEYVKIDLRLDSTANGYTLHYLLDSKYYDGGIFTPSAEKIYRPVDDTAVEEYHDEFRSILWQLLKP